MMRRCLCSAMNSRDSAGRARRHSRVPPFPRGSMRRRIPAEPEIPMHGDDFLGTIRVPAPFLKETCRFLMTQRPPERVMLSQEKLADAVGDRWSDAELSEAVALLTRADGRFPAGVRTLPADLVRAIQRLRLLAAMIKTVTEIGNNTLTVQNVLTRAGISRPTFYEQFEDKEDCFLAAFDAAAARMQGRLEAAVADAGTSWRERLRSGIAELLRD